LAYTSNISLT